MQTIPNPAEAAPTNPPLEVKAVVALKKPVTYEECVSTIDDAKQSGSPEMKDTALDLLKTFFEERISKKAATDEKDVGAAVKRSAMGKRTYTPYQAGGNNNGPKT